MMAGKSSKGTKEDQRLPKGFFKLEVVSNWPDPSVLTRPLLQDED